MQVWFFDEGRFGLKPCTGRAWCRRSRRPVALVRPGYKNFYLFSAVNPNTGQEFTLQLPTVDTEMMSLYLDHLSQEHPGAHILLVLDGAGWHKAKELKVPDGIELVPLPPYSPELNPAERLWQWLRLHVCRNRLFSSLNDLEQAICDSWHLLSPNLLSALCHCSYLYD